MTPVTILAGFLGAGKTTILNHILSSDHGKKIALIVNDMSEVNIDSSFLASGGQYSESRENLVQMTNGCICCTLRADLLNELHRLSQGGFDHILIESTGIAEPMPIAVVFDMTLPDGSLLNEHVTLDTIVTVVDAVTFLDHFSNDAPTADGKSLNTLMMDQVEFANVLMITKGDLVTKTRLSQTEELLSQLCPNAEIAFVEHGAASLDLVFGRNDFNIILARKNSMWHDELISPHAPETEEYDFSSCVFRTSVPMSSAKVLALMHKPWKGVLRAKGMIRTDDGDGGSYYFSLVGRERNLTAYPHDSDAPTEVVFIGQGLDKGQLIQEWARCEASAPIDTDMLGKMLGEN